MSSYNRERDRERDRSRSRDKYNRDSSRDRDRNVRGEKEREKSFRDRDRSRDRDRDRDRERDRDSRKRSRSRSTGRREDTRRPKVREDSRRPEIDTSREDSKSVVTQILSAKQAEEQKKKERLALAKRLQRGDSSDEDEVEEDGEVEDLSAIQSEALATEQDLMRALGFGGFDSTKGKQIVDNKAGAAVGAVAKHKKRVYRQYMNRRGGFNRPLQKIA